MVGLAMRTGAAKSAILSRIKDAIGARPESAAQGHATIERSYTRTPASSREACLALFVDRLLHYQVVVRRIVRAEIAATVAATLAVRARSRLVVPADLDRSWLPEGIAAVPDRGLGYHQLDASEGVLTACSLGIAATGTIVLRHGPGEGRRALTLIPDYHLCVVMAEQVVETVPEAFRWLAAERPALITTISGPSATADIEMTRVRGVHGPRTLDVLIVENPSAV
jgi:L-lactate dehydrogenase complex protein LldG